MSDDFRIKRHVEVAAQTARAMKRISLAGLVFGSFILVNVLQPYSDDFDTYLLRRESVDEKETAVTKTTEALQAVRVLSGQVTQTMETIKRAPWKSHKDELIETYADMQARETGTPSEYQSLADATVERIADDIRLAISPVGNTLETNPDLRQAIPEIDGQQNELTAWINTWEKEKLGDVWYGTIGGKETTLRDVNNNVEGRVGDMATEVEHSIDRLSATVDATKRRFDEDLARQKREALDEQAKLDTLNEKMQSVMPTWVRGLISVEQMVQMFPLIVFGIAVYLLYSGLSLTRHHEIIAHAKRWTTEERQDPLYSAPWTLVYRGRIGTATTIVLYAGVFAVSWMFVNVGGDVLLAWLGTGHVPAVNQAVFRLAINSILVLLFAGLACVLWRTLKGQVTTINQ